MLRSGGLIMESLFSDKDVWGKSSKNRLSNSESIQASVNKSGNSDVDVNVMVEIDMVPVALAFLCLSLVKKEISNEEFEKAAIIRDEIRSLDRKLDETARGGE